MTKIRTRCAAGPIFSCKTRTDGKFGIMRNHIVFLIVFLENWEERMFAGLSRMLLLGRTNKFFISPCKILKMFLK